MISDLIIKNFAIIESLHISFAAGFNVLTGETGAGKSIIIDAVNLLLGGRARGDIIRTGAEEATVEAIFSLGAEGETMARLDEAGLADGDELVVRRIVSRSGKNRVFINGSLVPLAQLRELTTGLVNIYGQHEHQNLQRSEAHLELLDHFAGAQPELGAYRELYSEFAELRRQLERLDLAERERQQRVDLLSYQRQELERVRLQPGEDDELERERSLLVHGEKLMAASAGGYESLYAGQQAVCAMIAEVAARLEGVQRYDEQLAPLVDRLNEHLYGLEDIATELRAYSEKLDFEPERQEQVEERLALLAGLKRKYAPDVTGLLAYLERITAELEDLTNVEGRRGELTRSLERCHAQLLQAAERLSRKREAAAAELSVCVERELADLAMPRARFTMHFESLLEASANGMETGEFYLAANPGEAAQPLAKIASGGELSRIMLALKRSAPEGDGVRTLIFDEVDAGIGGEAATAVGEKVGRLGADFQVLCVTHLPQVAAFADHHYQVRKNEEGGRTTTGVVVLNAEDRVAEVARMLGGLHAGKQSQEHARELIAASKRQF
ncbi:MAG: DNA repair protein RecN [Desulfuromonas sp.]|nr:MAG: DNA repair protein RecN [Desulfuromonas sp.]